VSIHELQRTDPRVLTAALDRKRAEIYALGILDLGPMPGRGRWYSFKYDCLILGMAQFDLSWEG